MAAWHGPNNHPALKAGRPGERMKKDVSAIDMNEGNAIPYRQENPARGIEQALAREGAVSLTESRRRPGADVARSAAQPNPAGDEAC